MRGVILIKNNLSHNKINESNLIVKQEKILNSLLKDQTTGTNIKWGTDSYNNHGYSFRDDQEITVELITGWYDGFIRPRVDKDIDVQLQRQRNKAEVFTPSWVINLQVDAALEDMKNLPLIDFIQTKWLEITCGEAPYMVNRYDMNTGTIIPLKKRAGFIDVKFKKLNEEIEAEEEWVKLAIEIYKASYGYEYQGDSLLLARENLLLTFIDNYFYMFGAFPDNKLILEMSKIVSSNVIQMDGLTYEVPYSDGGAKEYGTQLNLFEEIDIEEMKEPQLAKINLWKKKKIIDFKEIIERVDSNMKFDVVIGNPPYQAEAVGANNQKKQIYNLFIDEASKIGEKTILITPARYLFNTGGTPKKWNEKMLESEHLKIIYYEPNSNKVFENVRLKGGIAILYIDNTQKFEPINLFISDPILSNIYHKIVKYEGLHFDNLGNLVFSPDSYRFEDKMFEENPQLKSRTDKSHLKSVSSNVFERYPEVFNDYVKEDPNYIQIYGREDSSIRKFKYINRKYVRNHKNIDKWKLFIPGASGSGHYGEALGEMVVASPSQGHNQTFLSIGTFDTKFEADSLLKYLKSKFGRALLGIMKSTHNNQSKKTWSTIPLQDFTYESDIDWKKSISEIDQQLYGKYDLNEEEITFIETNVKEME